MDEVQSKLEGLWRDADAKASEADESKAGGAIHGSEAPSRKCVEDGRILKLPLSDGGAGDGGGATGRKTKWVRIVHVSDTHGRHGEYLGRIPDGDVFVHSGDFAKRLRPHEYAKACKEFNTFLGALPHKHKLFVAGNHEVAFNDKSKEEIQEALSNCLYLQDDTVVLEGLKFYGSPWTSSRHMGFSSRHLKKKWAHIPDDTDVLVTHMPPFALFDLAWVRDRDDSGVTCTVCGELHPQYRHWGCPHLRETVLKRVHPRVHLYGHVHDANGAVFNDGTLFINSAMDLDPTVHVVDVEVRVQPATGE